MKDIAAQIAQFTDTDIRALETNGKFDLTIQEENISLSLSDVEIITEDVPGWSVATEGSVTVALDITVTDELRSEGIARDFINRIQNLRKESGFEVTDKIQISLLDNNEVLTRSLLANKSYICQEVQAIDLQFIDEENGLTLTEIEMDEFLLKVAVKVV